MTDQELFAMALRAREKAYCPYSHYSVGAALLCADGTVFEGCNIENAAFTPSICAERTAFSQAILQGKRDFVKIAIAGGRLGQPPEQVCPPCGVCRQVMIEFCDADRFQIVLGADPGHLQAYTLHEIMPLAYGKDKMT